MLDIRIDDTHAYIEVNVYGEYDQTRMAEVFDAMRAVTAKHGHFSELEVHHGKITNLLSTMSKVTTLTKTQGNSEEYKFLTKIRRYALVADDPGLFFKIISQLSGKKMRLFRTHEIEEARRWIEQAHMMAG